MSNTNTSDYKIVIPPTNTADKPNVQQASIGINENNIKNNVKTTLGMIAGGMTNGLPRLTLQQEQGSRRDWFSVIGVAVGVVIVTILKSVLISYVWNSTMPYLTEKNNFGKPFIREINWKIALGLLLLLSLLCVKPCF